MECLQAYLWLLTEHHTVTYLGLNPEVNNALCKVEQMRTEAPLIIQSNYEAYEIPAVTSS